MSEPHFAPLNSDRLSWYRTPHQLTHFAELTALEGLPDYQQWANRHGRAIYYLGNGSNTLFRTTCVETAVLRNAVPRSIVHLGGDEFEVSSSTPVMQVLRRCVKDHRHSFYYLASVPATIGGALAMNAGRGRCHSQSIFDFVRRVTYMLDGAMETVTADALTIGYRSTPFTGIQNRFLVSAVFAFPPVELFLDNPITDRVAWASKHQDIRYPNCGSVFSKSDPTIMRFLMGRALKGARWSPKTKNWLQNVDGCRSEDMVRMIRHAQNWHRVLFRASSLEVVIVR